MRVAGKISRIKERLDEVELSGIQSEIVKDIRFRRVEHPEGAANHCVSRERPCQADARRPVALVKLNAGMGHGIDSIGSNNNAAIQIKVPHAAVGRRGDLVTQSQIQSQVRTNPPVVLNEFCQVPIARRIQACQLILFKCVGNT